MTSTILLQAAAVAFAVGCGWFMGSRQQRKRAQQAEEEMIAEYQDKLTVLSQEKDEIEKSFEQSQEERQDDQASTFSKAFLSNGRSVEAISTDLKTAQQSVSNAFSGLPKIYESIELMRQTMVKGKDKINNLSESVDAWQGSLQTLQTIQDLIEGIHQKSIQIRDVSGEANLLALNASIEAARAGEHGRGFSVVAECMRELSNKSAAATEEINTSVEMTKSEVTSIIDGIESSVSLLSTVSNEVTSQFGALESEVITINEISEKSSQDASEAEERFVGINSNINNQLESITKLLSDTMGAVTGNKVEDIPIHSDISAMKVIDVRRPDEFNDELGHIKGAELITLDDKFELRIGRLDKEKLNLFVCRSGGRSARAARIALAYGHKHVFNLEGGMLAWKSSGRDSERNDLLSA